MRGRICKQRTAAFRRIVPSGQRFRQVSELRDVSITGFTALIDGGEDYNPELHHFVVWGCARTTLHRTALRRPGSWCRSAHGDSLRRAYRATTFCPALSADAVGRLVP